MTAAPLIDTHCHLALLEERGMLHAALEGAAAAGVVAMVTIGVNLEDSDRNRVIAEAHDEVFFAVGWDPQQPHAPDSRELHALQELIEHPRAVAVGEVGLDLFFRPGYHETSLEVQQRSFNAMLELAGQERKPVVVHDRDAHTEVLHALEGHRAVNGIMHCFTGDAAHMEACVQRGFAVSFAGIVTFNRSDPIQAAARGVPDDMYMVETDSPFLAPVPHRGTVNLPERVADTAARIANLRDVSAETVRKETTRNARRILALGA